VVLIFLAIASLENSSSGRRKRPDTFEVIIYRGRTRVGVLEEDKKTFEATLRKLVERCNNPAAQPLFGTSFPPWDEAMRPHPSLGYAQITYARPKKIEVSWRQDFKVTEILMPIPNRGQLECVRLRGPDGEFAISGWNARDLYTLLNHNAIQPDSASQRLYQDWINRTQGARGVRL
ncbi:MAG: hypothetical protein AAF517_24020, partial [Planctomycetota bacterium]